ncbi:MAG: methyltransferase domain-containing protein [Desulfobulbaceae bacterium]|nr:methyltransferase domain-containing protein [Desulfobulbaceae bacterium]
MEIQRAIRKKYQSVSQSAKDIFLYPTGRSGANHLGYDSKILDRIPDTALNSFCGVGNPFSIAPIAPNSHILDIGCGAGCDLNVASRLTGERGKVSGMELTPEMAQKAEQHLAVHCGSPYEISIVLSEKFPYRDNHFDVVISNGVINLFPDKQQCFNEIYRVLKPGGKLQFADVVLQHDISPPQARSVESWAQ